MKLAVLAASLCTLLFAHRAQAYDWPPEATHSLELACGIMSNGVFRQKGIEKTPEAASQYCGCYVKSVQDQISFTESQDIAQMMRDYLAKKPLTAEEQRLFEKQRDAGRLTQQRCACYVRTKPDTTLSASVPFCGTEPH